MQSTTNSRVKRKKHRAPKCSGAPSRGKNRSQSPASVGGAGPPDSPPPRGLGWHPALRFILAVLTTALIFALVEVIFQPVQRYFWSAGGHLAPPSPQIPHAAADRLLHRRS